MSSSSDFWSHQQQQAVTRRMADMIHSDVKDMVQSSRLSRKPKNLLLVQRDELAIQELLGQGAFSQVHQVTLKHQQQQQQQQNNQNHNKPYAMKHLKPRLVSQPENFRLAAGELALEAHLLASFDHPNILQIHGWAANGVASFLHSYDSFFLLLDCLDETLDARIQKWLQKAHVLKARSEKVAAHPTNTMILADWWRRVWFLSSHHHNHHHHHHHHHHMSTVNNEHHQQHHHDEEEETMKQQERILLEQEEHLLYLEKLSAVTEVAAGLSYLHDHGVIFRDLKPNNIGFLNGRVKLFDFGLSRELPHLNVTEPFEMSGRVGTLRYMATEVASHQPYNVSADVYSWAIVAYEVLSLQKPFAGWTRDMHASLVCRRGVRPETHNLIPTQLKPLLVTCWSPRPDHRPTMTQVCHTLCGLEEQALQVMQQHQQQQQRNHQQQHEGMLSVADDVVVPTTTVTPSQPPQQHTHNDDEHNDDADEEEEMVVELPQDFCIKKQPPGRNHSETINTRSTSATSSVSIEETASSILLLEEEDDGGSSHSHSISRHQRRRRNDEQQQPNGPPLSFVVSSLS